MLAQLPDAERDVRFVPEDDPWGRHWNAGNGSGLYTSQVAFVLKKPAPR